VLLSNNVNLILGWWIFSGVLLTIGSIYRGVAPRSPPPLHPWAATW